jgi:ribosome-associated protein
MHNQEFPSRGGIRGSHYNLNGEEFIELIKLLKIMRISESGGQAKQMVEDGIVLRNGEPEFRKRAKLRTGDVIEVFEFKIRII